MPRKFARGMQLMRGDKVGVANILLANVRGGARQVLDIANLGKLFQIV